MLACLMIVLLAVAPSAAVAKELNLRLKVDQEWDGNAANSPSDEQDEFSVKFSPRVEIRERYGELQWRLSYEPSYELFYTQSDLNGFDHRGRLEADWQVTPQTTLELREVFSSTQSTTSFNEQVASVDGTQSPEVVFGRRRVNRNNASLGLRHRLSPAQTLSLGISHSIRDDDGNNVATVQTFAANTNYRVAMTERSTLGAGFSFTRQKIDGTDLQDSRDIDFYNAFGFLEHRFDPSLSVSLTAGPALIDGGPSQDPASSFDNVQLFPSVNNEFVAFASCPVQDGDRILDTALANSQCSGTGVSNSLSNLRVNGVPFLGRGSVSNTRLTLFTNAAVTKQWEQWAASLSYRRSNISSAVTSEIADIVRSTLTWRPAPRWNVRLAGIFTRRTQATDAQVTVAVLQPSGLPDGSALVNGFRGVTLDNDLEILQYVGQLDIRYQLRKNLGTSLRFFYSKQQPDGDVQFQQDVEDVRVALGFEYSFEPFHF